jgi:predicted DNA-binding transcriptional regulator YafY
MKKERRELKTERVLRIHTQVSLARSGLTTRQILAHIEEYYPEQDPQNLKRYLYKDLILLESMGYLKRSERRKTAEETRWKAVNLVSASKSLKLDLRELLALFLAKGALRPLQHSPLYEDLERLFEKVERLMGDDCRLGLEELRQEWHFEPGPQWGLGVMPEVLNTVNDACEKCNLIDVDYYSLNSGSQSKRVLGPHFLYIAQGSLYLIAEDMGDHAVKTFALPRFRSATKLNRAYLGTRTDPKTFFKDAFGVFRPTKAEKVRVEVAPPMANHVKERRWHLSQRVVNLENGRVEVQFEVGITPELIQWVLGLGEHGLVREPLSLREAVITAANKISKNYKKAG